MFIVWGTKIRRKRLGKVGDFCCVCREVTVQRAKSVNLVSHVYFLAIGRGTRVRDEVMCEKCGVLVGLPAGTVQGAVRRFEGDAGDLARQTSPRGAGALAERLALESRIKSGAVSRDERLGMIAEAVDAVTYLTELRLERGAGRSIDSLLALLMIGVGLTSLGFGVAWSDSRPRDPALLVWCIVCGVSALALVVLLVYRGITARRRDVRRHAMKFIARALAPLRPREDEIAEVLGAMREERHLIARSVDESLLKGAIERRLLDRAA